MIVLNNLSFDTTILLRFLNPCGALFSERIFSLTFPLKFCIFEGENWGQKGREPLDKKEWPAIGTTPLQRFLALFLRN